MNEKWDGRAYRHADDNSVTAHSGGMEPGPVESVLVVDDSATVRAVMRFSLAQRKTRQICAASRLTNSMKRGTDDRRGQPRHECGWQPPQPDAKHHAVSCDPV